MASEDTFTAEVPTKIESTKEYESWLNNLTGTDPDRVEAARAKIESEGVVTSAKSLGDGLYEKKWKSGLRVYFAVTGERGRDASVLLLGSGKGKEQHRAISECKNILSRYPVYKGDIRKKD